MADETIIAWTDHTFNIAWGCVKVSPGCAHCYADTLSDRWGYGGVWGKDAPRRTFGDKYWVKPLKWNREAQQAGKVRLVFCSSMCDVFEDHPTIAAERAKLWVLIRQTPWLIWQLLTKRPERIAGCLPNDWGAGYPNVWLGTSIENQDYIHRAEELSKVPAIVRFVSYEPALGPLDLRRFFGYNPVNEDDDAQRRGCLRCGYQWRTENRREGARVAVGNSHVESLAGESGNHSMRTSKSGESDRGISSSARDVPSEENTRMRSPAGLVALQRADTARLDDTPQESHSIGQPPFEPHDSDLLRAASRSSEPRPGGRAQSSGQADKCPGCGDSHTALRGGRAYLNSQGSWCELPACFRDCKSSSPLISWVVYGGESGPNFRDHEPAWPRDMRDRCRAAGIPFFYKQSPAFRTEMGTLLDGEEVREYPADTYRPAVEPAASLEMF